MRAHQELMQTHHPAACAANQDRCIREVAMENLEETLERISRSGEAAFAMDGGNRITHWNKACEKLLGKPARHVLGKRCNDVMCGRDVHGNAYCHTSCPAAHQARDFKDDPVHTFELEVAAGDGTRRRLATSLFAVPSYHPALTAVVHVLRPVAGHGVAREAESSTPRPPAVSDYQGKAADLTTREKEVLRCLTRGLSTPTIANELSIARVTVRNHVQSILQRLDVHSKLEAVVEARRAGIA
jgi:DNA-binding CsgD family transcriptional regulator